MDFSDQKVKGTILGTKDVHKMPADGVRSLIEAVERARIDQADTDAPPKPPATDQASPPEGGCGSKAPAASPRSPPHPPMDPAQERDKGEAQPPPIPEGPTSATIPGRIGAPRRLEASFADVALTMTCLTGMGDQDVVKDFLEVIRSHGKSVVEILARFEPTERTRDVAVPAAQGALLIAGIVASPPSHTDTP